MANLKVRYVYLSKVENRKTLNFTAQVKHAVAAVSVLVFAACTTTGVAVGKDVRTGKATEPVTLDWQSDPGDMTNGDIEVRLPSGMFYQGRYHQVTKTTMVEVLDPFWGPWPPYWSDWDLTWDASDEVEDIDDYQRFITNYDHHIIARLDNDRNAPEMRCRFTLLHPTDGMAGGGVGDCTVGKDEHIENAVLKRQPE